MEINSIILELWESPPSALARLGGNMLPKPKTGKTKISSKALRIFQLCKLFSNGASMTNKQVPHMVVHDYRFRCYYAKYSTNFVKIAINSNIFLCFINFLTL